MNQTPESMRSPAGPILLSTAEESDDEFLADLYSNTHRDEFAVAGWDDLQLGQFLKMQYGFQKQAYGFQFPGAESSIIRLGDQKIGRMIVYRSDVEIRLVDISLLPAFRNGGIGTKLIDELLKEAREKGLPVRLHVAVRNQAALRLYQKRGFTITGTDELDHSMEWRSDFGS